MCQFIVPNMPSHLHAVCSLHQQSLSCPVPQESMPGFTKPQFQDFADGVELISLVWPTMCGLDVVSHIEGVRIPMDVWNVCSVGSSSM